MKTIFVLILAFAASMAGAQSTTYAVRNSMTAHTDPTNKEQVEIYWTGPKLFVVSDRKGAVLMTAFKDGHVETNGHFKLRRGAKTFWSVMAQYFPAYCATPAMGTLAADTPNTAVTVAPAKQVSVSAFNCPYGFEFLRTVPKGEPFHNHSLLAIDLGDEGTMLCKRSLSQNR